MEPRIVFGPDTSDQTGQLASEYGSERAFLVTDSGIVTSGHVERVEASLGASGFQVRRFEGVNENPTSRDVKACRRALGDWDASIIIGLGGGSSLDVAKGCNFLLAGGGGMEDYRGRDKAKGTLLPMIALPTTAGTGSEVQSYALIEQEGTHQKMACGDPQAIPKVAILDPTLTVTQPRFVTACTGLDALAHAVETAVTTGRTPASSEHSRQAFKRIPTNLTRVLAEPTDLDARGQMMLAAADAGRAIEASMLGAAHAMANPLTAHHAITHGQAVAMMLASVVRYNACEPDIATIYAELAREAQLCEESSTDAEGVSCMAAKIEELIELAGFEGKLSAIGVSREELGTLAAESAEQWTAGFNPRKMTIAAFGELLEATF